MNSFRRADIPLPVVLNRSSGRSADREIARRVREAFQAAGAEANVWTARSGEEFVDLIRRASSEPTGIVVAGGGDGTMGSAASVLAGGEKALGVLPLGTLNHFAKDLGIPLDLPEAAANVVEGRVKKVDVGEVNGRVFVNNSSLGLYPRIVRHREEQRQRLGRGKWPALAWATLHTLHRHGPIDVVLSVNGREFQRRTPFVFVGNNFYDMDGFDVGTRERLDRGELSVYLAPGARPLDLVLLALAALFGRLHDSSEFEALRAPELRIETRTDRARVATDGEIQVLPTPLRYRVRPGALSVIVPQESPKEKSS